jgi:hypothetical protein
LRTRTYRLQAAALAVGLGLLGMAPAMAGDAPFDGLLDLGVDDVTGELPAVTDDIANADLEQAPVIADGVLGGLLGGSEGGLLGGLLGDGLLGGLLASDRMAIMDPTAAVPGVVEGLASEDLLDAPTVGGGDVGEDSSVGGGLLGGVLGGGEGGLLGGGGGLLGGLLHVDSILGILGGRL